MEQGSEGCFNRICASSTLSTHGIDALDLISEGVSIASAPHPPYPPKRRYHTHMKKHQVSIASAPHPPYPLLSSPPVTYAYDAFQSHLRLIHPIHADWSTKGRAVSGFQSHLRLIHPIHKALFMLSRIVGLCFNRICASSTLSTLLTLSASIPNLLVSIASAPHPPYPPNEKRCA